MPEPFAPLVTVGIPVHNGADLLGAALDSVLAQDYMPLEIVVSDNASDDGTESVARRFAAADPRVRYVRNDANIGFVPNFRKVLVEGRGKYFTWLAHDDLLTEAGYLSAVVGYLESHSEAVLCATSFRLSSFELTQSEEVICFPRFAPGLWPQGCRELFRWPHGWIDLLIYGVFRRENLVKIQFGRRLYKGRPHIFWWETEIFSELAGIGEVVVLPQCSRLYRRSLVSAGMRVVAEVSTFDLLLLGLQIKLILARRAWRLPFPIGRKLAVLATTVSNFFAGNLRQPYDHRREVRSLERSIAEFEAVLKERSQLLRSLVAEVESRRRAVADLGLRTEAAARGLTLDSADGFAAAKAGGVGGKPAPARRSYLADFFNPPLGGQIAYFRNLSQHLTDLQRRSAEALSSIESLHSEAAALMEIIETPESQRLGRPRREP